MSTPRDLTPRPDSLLTVAVVVRNDPTGLASTLASLASAWQPNTECLVLDGSDDPESTESIVANHSSIQVSVRWSEPRGVYPAMNDALTHAHGEYVWFVNAGDRAHSDSSISAVLRILEKRPLWAYGQVCFVDDRGRTFLPRPFDYQREKRSAFSRGRFPPHQGTVAATQVMRDLGGFDESFEVAADYAMMLKLSELGDPAESQEVWADFFEGGLSTIRWRAAVWEFHRARMKILKIRGSALVSEYLSVALNFVGQTIGRSRNSLRRAIDSRFKS